MVLFRPFTEKSTIFPYFFSLFWNSERYWPDSTLWESEMTRKKWANWQWYTNAIIINILLCHLVFLKMLNNEYNDSVPRSIHVHACSASKLNILTLLSLRLFKYTNLSRIWTKFIWSDIEQLIEFGKFQRRFKFHSRFLAHLDDHT